MWIYDVVGNAEGDLTLKLWTCQAAPRLIIQRHHAATIPQQLLALSGQFDRAANTFQQGLVKILFHALDLHRDRRLGQMHFAGRPRYAAKFGNRHK